MIPIAKKECGACVHFVKSPADVSGKVGQCRRYPPTALLVIGPQGPSILSDFPPTKKEFFCGEWGVDLMAVRGTGLAKISSDASQVNGD
jgi:hypothetical protein